MRITALSLLAVALSASIANSQARTPKTLDIYVIDVEGGNAVLFAAPSGESVLVDAGNGGEGAVRDTRRIMAAAKDAGIQQIDHLIITHYHGDHIGGLSELATHVPIKEFIDLSEYSARRQHRSGATAVCGSLWQGEAHSG